MDFETHDRSIIEDLGEEIAALKAENERLAKECGRLTVLVQDWKINCSHAERALAERAGGVKVLREAMVDAVVKVVQPYTRTHLFMDELQVIVRTAINSVMEKSDEQ